MNPESKSLPINFDGTFKFTNWSNTDFIGKWNNIAYTFPALKTVPLVIPGETLDGIQHVRKKFAKDLAEREYFRSKKYLAMAKGNNTNSLMSGVTYTDADLVEYIQRCLEPLPLSQAAMNVLPRDTEDKFRKDKFGKNVSKVVTDGESLVGDGTVMND